MLLNHEVLLEFKKEKLRDLWMKISWLTLPHNIAEYIPTQAIFQTNSTSYWKSRILKLTINSHCVAFGRFRWPHSIFQPEFSASNQMPERVLLESTFRELAEYINKAGEVSGRWKKNFIYINTFWVKQLKQHEWRNIYFILITSTG